MKKVFPLIFFFTIAGFASYAQVSWGVKAGLNRATTTPDMGSSRMGKIRISGIQAGVIADLPLFRNIHLQPQLLLATRGCEVMGSFFTVIDGVIGDYSYDLTVRPVYLELPLNVVYKIPVKRSHLLVGLGPYIAYGVGGKLKGFVQLNDQRADIDQKILFKESDSTYSDGPAYAIRRFDWGLSALVGYEHRSGLFVQAGYTLGMQNINWPQGTFMGTEASRHHQLQGSIGYLFRGRKVYKKG